MLKTIKWVQKLLFLTPDLLIKKCSFVLHILVNLWFSWDPDLDFFLWQVVTSSPKSWETQVLSKRQECMSTKICSESQSCCTIMRVLCSRQRVVILSFQNCSNKVAWKCSQLKHCLCYQTSNHAWSGAWRKDTSPLSSMDLLLNP